MKKLLLFLMALSITCFGAQPPMQRNPWATNIGPVIDLKGFSQTNGGSFAASGNIYSSGGIIAPWAAFDNQTNVSLRGAASNTTALTIHSNAMFVLVAKNPTNVFSGGPLLADYGAIIMGTNTDFGGVGSYILVPNLTKIQDALGNLIWFVPSHDGSVGGRPLLLMEGGKDIDFLMGPNGILQVGKTGGNYNGTVRHQYAGTGGYSVLDLWTARDASANAGDAYIVGKVTANGWGELEFGSIPPVWNTFPTPGFLTPGYKLAHMETNGWAFRGWLKQERTVTSSSSGVIDFRGAYAQDFTPATSPITMSFANQWPGTTNLVRKLVRIFSQGQSMQIIWPSGINVLSETGTGTLATNLAAGYILRVELESLNLGATNVQAHGLVGVDNGFQYDGDATNFFARASISDASQKAAVNTLVVSLKAASLWTNKFDVFYPFVGGSAGTHAQNLVSSAYTITFGSGVTHSANGVIFDGTVNGYGDTTYNPTTAAGVLSATSGHFSIYVQAGTNWPTASESRMGAAVGASIIGIRQASSVASLAYLSGANSIGGSFSLDERGPIMVSRNDSSTLAWGFKTTYTTSAQANGSLPNDEIYLGAENNGGAFKPISTTLCGATIGASLSSSEWAAFITIWNTYQATLSRQAP